MSSTTRSPRWAATSACSSAVRFTRIWRNRDDSFGHHLLDPSTGGPAWTGLVGATAIGDSALEAETLSKMALLLGPERARQAPRLTARPRCATQHVSGMGNCVRGIVRTVKTKQHDTLARAGRHPQASPTPSNCSLFRRVVADSGPCLPVSRPRRDAARGSPPDSRRADRHFGWARGAPADVMHGEHALTLGRGARMGHALHSTIGVRIARCPATSSAAPTQPPHGHGGDVTRWRTNHSWVKRSGRCHAVNLLLVWPSSRRRRY